MANIKVLNKISKDDLIDLYQEQKLSTRSIAKIYKCYQTTIGDLLKRYNIPLRPVGGARNVAIQKITHNGELVDAKCCTGPLLYEVGALILSAFYTYSGNNN